MSHKQKVLIGKSRQTVDQANRRKVKMAATNAVDGVLLVGWLVCLNRVGYDRTNIADGSIGASAAGSGDGGAADPCIA